MNEIDEKIERLVKMLDGQGLGGILLNAQHNFSWLSGGASNAIDLSRENGAASLFITSQGKRYLLANNIEMPRMLAEEIAADDFEPVQYSWQDEKACPDYVIRQASSLLRPGSELATDIPLYFKTRWLENRVAKCRYSLTESEIERLRRLGQDTANSIELVIDNIKSGESEQQIAVKLTAALAAKRVTSVVTLVAADERIANFRHPVPGDAKWNRTIMLVTSAKRGGLIVSISRIVNIGKVPEELQHRTRAAAFVNASLLAATRPGVHGSELYEIASAAYANQGFLHEINMHHQGGAVGYKTREWVAHPQSDDIVCKNQAFAWNPSITGTKIEDTAVVTEAGVEVVSKSARFPLISTEIDGKVYFSTGILSL